MHLCLLIAAIALMGTAQPGPGADAAGTMAPVLKRTIALPGVTGRIDHMACDAGGSRLFVAALGNGSLEVVDLDKGERTNSVPGLKEPQGVAFVASTGEVIVSCGGDGTVRAFDAATLAEKRRVEVGDDADNVRIDGAGGSMAVGYGGGAVAFFEATTLKKTGEIRLSGHPESFALEPAAGASPGRVFVNVPGGAVRGGGEVVVAESATGKVTATWKLAEAGRNFPMALDAGHHRLFVGCRRPAKLLVIDTESGATVATPECVGDADEVFVDGKTGRVLVVGGDGAIDVFESADRRTYTKAASVKTASGARTGLLVEHRRGLFVAVPQRAGRQAEIREYTLPD